MISCYALVPYLYGGRGGGGVCQLFFALSFCMHFCIYVPFSSHSPLPPPPPFGYATDQVFHINMTYWLIYAAAMVI